MEERTYIHRRISDFSRNMQTNRTLSSLSIGSTTGASSTLKMDSRPAVVIEVGNRLTRVGFAGEYIPREIFPTEYIDPLNPTTALRIFDDSYTEFEQHGLLIKFFKHVVFVKLLTTVNARGVVLVENLFTPTKLRNSIAKAFFECPSLSPYSILFAPSHLLCTFPFNAKNSLVVDVATKETLLFPIAEGFLMLNNYETTQLCTSSVESHLQKLLIKHGKVRNSGNSTTLRELNERDLNLMNEFKMIQDIVFRFCFVTTIQRGIKLQKHFKDDSTEIESPPPDVEIPLDTDFLVIPGYAREAAAEILFINSGDCDNRSIAQIILDAIVKVPIDLRQIFLNNLLIVGGISRMKGFMSRLKQELIQLIQTDYEKNISNLSKADINFYKFDSDICSSLFTAWLGGSLFGTLDIIESRSMTREDWFSQQNGKRNVPDWTNKIDDYFRTFETKTR